MGATPTEVLLLKAQGNTLVKSCKYVAAIQW